MIVCSLFQQASIASKREMIIKKDAPALSFDAWIISKDGIDEVLILVSGTKDATVGSMNAI